MGLLALGVPGFQAAEDLTSSFSFSCNRLSTGQLHEILMALIWLSQATSPENMSQNA
jgi:hypothetical protein